MWNLSHNNERPKELTAENGKDKYKFKLKQMATISEPHSDIAFKNESKAMEILNKENSCGKNIMCELIWKFILVVDVKTVFKSQTCSK